MARRRPSSPGSPPLIEGCPAPAGPRNGDGPLEVAYPSRRRPPISPGRRHFFFGNDAAGKPRTSTDAGSNGRRLAVRRSGRLDPEPSGRHVRPHSLPGGGSPFVQPGAELPPASWTAAPVRQLRTHHLTPTTHPSFDARLPPASGPTSSFLCEPFWSRRRERSTRGPDILAEAAAISSMARRRARRPKRPRAQVQRVADSSPRRPVGRRFLHQGPASRDDPRGDLWCGAGMQSE